MAYRQEVVLRTDGPSLRMSFFSTKQHIADWQAGRLAVGNQGVFTGQVSTFRDQWQLTNPKMLDLPRRPPSRTPRPSELQESIRGLFPVYPLTKGVDSWDLQRAITFARAVLDEVPDVVPADAAAQARAARRADGARLDPRAGGLRAGHLAPASTSATRRRW